MTTENNPQSSEKDFLIYRGNNVPRVIRLAWTILVLFCLYYLGSYMWPDLMTWMAKIK